MSIAVVDIVKRIKLWYFVTSGYTLSRRIFLVLGCYSNSTKQIVRKPKIDRDLITLGLTAADMLKRVNKHKDKRRRRRVWRKWTGRGFWWRMSSRSILENPFTMNIMKAIQTFKQKFHMKIEGTVCWQQSKTIQVDIKDCSGRVTEAKIVSLWYTVCSPFFFFFWKFCTIWIKKK